MTIRVSVNGRLYRLDGGWPGESLLYVLRERCGLTGTKNACEHGECGSCTVHMDGLLVNSCLVLAAQADGCEVTTVEGLGSGPGLHPIQQALLAAGAVQCGFCTPGMVLAAADLLHRCPHPSAAEIRRELAGNLCRCTGYQAIVNAISQASADGGPDGAEAP
jgi:aerobic carbon-monoxide dehydrogenase small subunit